MRTRGTRPRLAAPPAATGPGQRLVGRLARLLPDRAFTRRSGGCGALARTLPQPRAQRRARHRPRLPAGHPREADRRSHRALRSRARSARCVVRDVPVARCDSRRRQGAGPSVRRARAHRPRLGRLEREAHRRGAAAAPGCRSQAHVAALACVRRALPRDRRAAAPHLAASWRHGDLVAAARRARAGAARRDGRAGRCASGTRTRVPTPASSRSTCSGSGCSPPSRTASSRSRPCAGSRSTSRASRSTTRTSTTTSSARTRSATSRSRAARRCRACCARCRRTSTT